MLRVMKRAERLQFAISRHRRFSAMPSSNTKPLAPASPSSVAAPPIIVTLEEKNSLADATNPVLTSIPLKIAPPAPISVVASPPPAYTLGAYGGGSTGGDGGDRPSATFVQRLRAKFRRPSRWDKSGVCLPLVLIWLLASSFLAGLLFYRYFGRRLGEPSFYRWCGTDFLDDRLGERQRIEQKLEVNEHDVSFDRLNSRVRNRRFFSFTSEFKCRNSVRDEKGDF